MQKAPARSVGPYAGAFNCVRVRVSGSLVHVFEYSGESSLLPDGEEDEIDEVVRRIAAQAGAGGSVVLDVDVVFSMEVLHALERGVGLDSIVSWDQRTDEIRRRLVDQGLSADAISIIIT